ncbi:unnamed protein product, partial [marine sediment metagenome]
MKPGEINLRTGEVLNEYNLFERTDGKIEVGSKAYLNNREFKNLILP